MSSSCRWRGAETLQGALRHIEFLDLEIAAVERLIARAALGSTEGKRGARSSKRSASSV
jgi:hypothetical protein